MTFEEAGSELFRAPHAAFVTERKRLASELKAAGDKAGATRLRKLNRPPISAWAVNQLWWRERDAFDKLLETAERLRDGDLGGTAAHREALTALRTKAGALLAAADHSATESTLRRIQTTLSAVAAIGNFDPDLAGQLTDDRDPPGFEAAGIPGLAASVSRPTKDDEPEDEARATKREATETQRRADAEATAEKAQAAAERRKAGEAKARQLAGRHRHEAALRTAQGDVERRQRELDRLHTAVDGAAEALAKSVAIVTDLEAKLEEMADAD